MWFLRYVSGQTDRHTYRHKDRNTFHPYWGKVKISKHLISGTYNATVLGVNWLKVPRDLQNSFTEVDQNLRLTNVLCLVQLKLIRATPQHHWHQRLGPTQMPLCHLLSHAKHMLLSNWLTELRFDIPFNTKWVILKTFPKPISWLGMEKLNLTQQKHTFSNQKKCTTTQNRRKKLKPGLFASYDVRPGNGEGLFWFWHFTNLSLT